MTAARFEAEVLPHTPKLKQRAQQFVRGAGDAEDLVQETLLRAWKAWGRVEVVDVWSWLWCTMRNAWLDNRRSASCWASAVEAHGPEIADIRAVPPPAPDSRVTSGADDLDQCLRALRKRERQIIELQMLGYDDEAVARHLQMKVRTVRSQACVARQRLRAVL